MTLQNIPVSIVICLAVTGIGALQGGVHRLFHGQSRPILRDKFDWQMDKRDELLEVKGNN